jgi:hypothetical protein
MTTYDGTGWTDAKPYAKDVIGNRKNWNRFLGICHKKHLEAYFSSLWLCKI